MDRQIDRGTLLHLNSCWVLTVLEKGAKKAKVLNKSQKNSEIYSTQQGSIVSMVGWNDRRMDKPKTIEPKQYGIIQKFILKSRLPTQSTNNHKKTRSDNLQLLL